MVFTCIIGMYVCSSIHTAIFKHTCCTLFMADVHSYAFLSVENREGVSREAKVP